jgi:hypothetical protein
VFECKEHVDAVESNSLAPRPVLHFRSCTKSQNDALLALEAGRLAVIIATGFGFWYTTDPPLCGRCIRDTVSVSIIEPAAIGANGWPLDRDRSGNEPVMDEEVLNELIPDEDDE